MFIVTEYAALTNSAEHDEMPLHAVFHPGIHSLLMYKKFQDRQTCVRFIFFLATQPVKPSKNMFNTNYYYYKELTFVY